MSFVQLNSGHTSLEMCEGNQRNHVIPAMLRRSLDASVYDTNTCHSSFEVHR